VIRRPWQLDIVGYPLLLAAMWTRDRPPWEDPNDKGIWVICPSHGIYCAGSILWDGHIESYRCPACLWEEGGREA
jgi:hypothetical protein